MNKAMMPPQTIPYSIDAEESVLGSVLIDQSALPRVLQILGPEHFYTLQNQFIYKAFIALQTKGAPIDLITLVTELENSGHLAEVGGAARLAQLMNAVPSAMNVEHYATMVKDTWRRRKVVEAASTIAKIGYDESMPIDGNLAGIISELSGVINKPTADSESPLDTSVQPLPIALIEGIADVAEDAGTWVDTYIDYARASAPMTPRLFHESAALWLASVMIARRLVLRMPFDNIYPNLWISWIAPSTIFQKSTAMKIAIKTAYRLAPHLVAPEESTPEALIRDMSGMDPENLTQLGLEDQRVQQEKKNFSAQRGWSMDEFSGLLASTGRDYNAGLIEILLKLYDCTDTYTRSTAGRGLQVVHRAYLTLLSASTPAAMGIHLNAERLWGMGWWPRFAVLTPADRRPEWAEPWHMERPDALNATLVEMDKRLPQPRWPEPVSDIPVTLGDGVFELWNQYNKTMRYDLITDQLDQRLWYLYGRLPTQALKVGMIIAALDWHEGAMPRVELPAMARALCIVEEWRESGHRALLIAAEEAQDRLRQRVMYQISKADPFGCTMRDLCKALKGVKPSEVERCIQELLTGGAVQVQEIGSPRGGPKVMRYFLARD